MGITKGKWGVIKSDFGFTIKAEQSIANGFDEDADVEIAEMNIYLDVEGEAEANANLIASSPKMRAALLMARNELCFGGNWEDAKMIIDEALSLARGEK